MDLLASLLLGVVVLIIVATWIMSAIGVGKQLLDPLVAVLGAPVIWLSRRVNAARRRRGIAKLPSGVPPPPSAP